MKHEYMNDVIEGLLEYGENGIRIKQKDLKSLCDYLYHRLSHGKIEYDDWVAQFAMEMFLSAKKFKANEEEWHEMTHKGGEYDYLLKYIYRRVECRMVDFMNETQGKHVQINGVQTFLTVNVDSIDKPIANSDDLNIINALTSNNQLIDNHEYYKSDIAEWFDSVKDEILTKNQLQLLNDLADHNLTMLEDDEVIKSATGKKKFNVSQNLKQIAKRIVRAYNEEFDENIEMYKGGMLRKINSEILEEGKIHEIDSYGCIRPIEY